MGISGPLFNKAWNAVRDLDNFLQTILLEADPFEQTKRRAATIIFKAMIEIYYRPGGLGFIRAREDFYNLRSEQNL